MVAEVINFMSTVWRVEPAGLPIFPVHELGAKERMKRKKWAVIVILAAAIPFAITFAVRSVNKIHEIADLEYALENEDPDVRLAAIAQLAEYGEEGVPSIKKALKDNDGNIQNAAITVLIKIKGKPSADALAELLSDPDRNKRVRAIVALGLTGRPAMPHLLKAVNTEPFPRGRMFAANAIVQLAEPGDAPAIMKVFQRQDTATKMYLISALAQINDAEAHAGLETLAVSQDAQVRYYVVNSLAEHPQKEDLPIFIKGISDESDNVRMWAMFGLETLNLPESYPVVLLALEDNVWYIRKEAAYTLGNLGNSDAVPHLVPYLKDPHPLVRGDAAESLGKLGTPELAPDIRPLLTVKSPPVQIKAAEALARLNDFSGMEHLIAILDSPMPLYRREAYKALKGISNQDFGGNRKKWAQWWNDAEKKLKASPNNVVEG